MQHKKTQLAPKHEGRPPLQEAARTFFGECSGHESLRTDLKSIVSAARLLPAEVARLRAFGGLCACNWKKRAFSVVL
jgi:hypothetical protein